MRRTVAALIASIAVAALAGCGSDDTSTPPRASTQTMTEAATTTTSAGVTWEYLQSEHADFLSMSCENKTGPSLMACAGLMNVRSKAFAIDAEQLPPSDARAGVLDSVNELQSYDEKLVTNQCGARPDALDCATAPGLINMTHSGIVTVVNREAAAEG
ncbi:hypothetical protein ACPXCG_12240 [Gordonia sp. DT218]|uniref:hypothetical protein n=1 Tax=Gordonia sp. DT218 TaxID=3416659 RepID=UPI003CF38E68